MGQSRVREWMGLGGIASIVYGVFVRLHEYRAGWNYLVEF
jgi:hypothetical protein